ncbi:hypothetical protein KFE25_002554 [Diacronema lutheri]|uniref:GDT1 family protein n=1 Tax=Diacronema lutheri TaxID=2081491 RepID=A0A8J5X9M8_DIALT|nr:hypothetical protein KFE25_002554 [Diacronema lutheri]
MAAAELPIAHQPDGVFSFFSPQFSQAFAASLSVIVVSELGDKTFFIAAIMAMRHPRGIIFAGAICALGLMTVLSCLMGHALPSMLPKAYTHYAAALLFLVFGVRLLKDAAQMEGGVASDELEEVEAELGKKEEDDPEKSASGLKDVEAGSASSRKEAGRKRAFLPPAFVQSFSLTFLAEWGDRSQIATIALAAAKDPFGVTLGGTIGHALCTGLAVVGGRMLASRISERMVAFVGGSLFLVFGLVALVEGPGSAL